jgi:hypothetical protein
MVVATLHNHHTERNPGVLGLLFSFTDERPEFLRPVLHVLAFDGEIRNTDDVAPVQGPMLCPAFHLIRLVFVDVGDDLRFEACT